MALKVASLAARDWRNLERLDLALDPSLTLLVGPNASGKTNTIEALTLLTRASSPRHAKAADLVREGARSAWAKARLEGDGRVIDLAISVNDGRSAFSRNGKPTTPGAIQGTLLSVLFTPDDLLLVKGPAANRRSELDDFGAQASGGFSKVARTYQRSITQRNRLLKEDDVNPSILDAWDESLALGGATLTRHRLSLFCAMKPFWEEAYRTIASGEELEVSYESTIAPGARETAERRGELAAEVTREELVELMAAALAASREEDLRRRLTTVGPHRDDVKIEVGGRDARTFASQGQQRSIVLAWKIAQVRFAEAALDERPILLLDDVMSELDETRRKSLSELADEGIQTVITTTHLGYFDDAILSRGRVVRYGHG